MRRWLTRRKVVNALTVLAIIGGLWWNQSQGLKAVATETHAGLCALRNDVQVRHDTTVAYLKENPHGVVSPKTGAIIITRAQLDQSLRNQESTLNALDESGLNCDPPKEN